MNNYENMILKAEAIQNKETRAIAKKLAAAFRKENAGTLETCIELARFKARQAGDYSPYKGFGDACHSIYGVSESVASRRVAVATTFYRVGDDGRGTWGRFEGFSFTALRDMYDRLRPADENDPEKILAAVTKWADKHFVVAGTSKRDIENMLPAASENNGGKAKKATAAAKKADKATAENGTCPGASDAVTSAELATAAIELEKLAKLAAGNTDAINAAAYIGGLINRLAGVTVTGLTRDAVMKAAGVDAAASKSKTTKTATTKK